MSQLNYAKTDTAKFLAVDNTSHEIISDMSAGKGYEFTCSTNCFIKQGATTTVTASAADANIFVPALKTVNIHGSNGNALAVIRHTADGGATIHRVDKI